MKAGSVLLREGHAALDAVAAAERRTRRVGAADGDARLVLVTKAGATVELLAKLLSAYAAEPEAVPVEVLLCGPGEQERMLRDGRADVGLLHHPFDSTTGLDIEEVSTEGQVAVLPVVDAPQVTTVIAWPPQSTSRALAALVRTATRL